jgi:hypothetical protein
MLEGVQAVVGSRSSGVESSLVFVCFLCDSWVGASNFSSLYRCVRARALEIRIWLELGHVVLWELDKTSVARFAFARST